MVAPKTVWKTILESILVAELVLMPLFIPLAARAQDFPMDSPSDPGGLDEFPSTGSGGGTGSGSGFSLGSLGGILSSSGVSCGGSGGAGGFLGSIFGSALGSVGNIFGGFLGGSGGGVGGALGGILGGSTGGALGGVLGGVMGGGEVPVNDKTVRNETGRIRTNTGEIVKKECVLDPITKAITAVLLKTLGSRIISWIQESDIGFIKNYEMEFRKAEQERAEEFRRNLAITQMGYGINRYVDNVLAYPKPGSNKLAETFTCPVPELRDGSFNADFNNGGWEAFSKKMRYSQCNAEGATLLAMEEESAQVRNKLRAQTAEINANSGFKGYGVKTKENCGPVIGRDGVEYIECTTEQETRTPGESIKDLMNRIFGSGIDWVINADEVNEAIIAAIMFLADTLVKTSSGPDGKGVFAPELSAAAASSPGIFSESTLMVQLNTQIARADKGIEIIDGRLTDALSAVFREGEILLSLRRTLATLTAALAVATEPGEIAAISAEITSTNTLINTSLTRLSSAKAELAAAASVKELIAKARADLLTLRSRLLSTTKIEDVEVIATDAINLTNALDIFFEIASLSVVSGLTGTADIKISTIEQIDQTLALAGRAASFATAFGTGATRVADAALTSQIPVLNTKKLELSSISSSLTALRAVVNAATEKETIRTESINATNMNISATAKVFEINQTIASAIRDFNP
ncbi:MAG: hypothetical protein A2131_02080 [Candidatus Sungbacteria bacterium GWC2_49_10]|uniref:Uncharacterized protein n=2 Tax=Parcubacteria group TaxID=1794811 RepID=A0A0G1Z147_9BACT|nr:MAG: hypothetical protein UY60_C0001G0027 [Parcubacteria group bacterium GW2011_GWB1_50_9]KKW21047.1 MAG: hypothetical protein UY61_C0016G0003 [Candidatus Adlerbacteria bacterium GW2011_GWC1_50_9]OGZ93301.1 MAG: hypothetical protein A2131_02080 [Candidatus Sungbacteria bacterium GWC2_49_10]